MKCILIIKYKLELVCERVLLEGLARKWRRTKKIYPGGRPSKLSTHNKQSIVHQITTGKLDNAVQATQFINSIIPKSVSSHTVKRTLKEAVSSFF
jgi:hypothetical protein